MDAISHLLIIYKILYKTHRSIKASMRNLIKSFLNSSIQHKLMVTDMAISFVALLILTSLTITYQFYSVQEATTKELKLAGHITSQLLAPVIEFSEDIEDAHRTLDTLKSKDSVILVCVYRKNKTLFVSQKYEQEEMPCPLNPKVGSKSNLNQVSVIREIITTDGGSVGYIYILSDMRELHTQLIGFSVVSILVMFLVFFVVYLTTRYVHTFITDPILKLARLAESVQKRENYSVHFTKEYDDEIGILAHAFNNMMQRIKGRDDMLEKKVKERTKNLRFTISRLEKLSEDRKRMVQNVSHEFRTPIHAIGQYNQFIIKGLGDEKAPRSKLKKYGERILQAQERLTILTEGLLDLSAMESGKIHIEVGNNDLIETITSSISELETKIEEKNLNIDLKEPSFSTKAYFDKNRIHQVITNIVGNATKFSPEDGIITIALNETMIYDESGSYKGIEVHVKDEGVGIPEGEEEDIFDAFTQSTKTYDGSGGTGLGLSISRTIIHSHKGEISVKNNYKGKGATFTFSIPTNLNETHTTKDV